MAVEKDFELLDDYLSNRLSPADREAFENKLEADLDLKQEFEFQQSLVEGVRSKRIAELKTMLNNIPASAIPTDQTALFTKIIGSVIVVGLVATGMYFYMSTESLEEVTEPENLEIVTESGTAGKQGTIESPRVSSTDGVASTTEPNETEANTATKSATQPKSTPITKEMEAELKKERDLIKVVSSTFVTSSTEVITESGSENINFHYAFKNKKLVLYGSFETNQYQILEFITADQHVFFLSYKKNYYLLDEKKDSPTPLVHINDPQLQKRLQEFRNK